MSKRDLFRDFVRKSALASMVVAMPLADAYAESITVPVGRSELITVSADMKEVVVSNPQVADAYVHDKRRISISGLEFGTTDVRVFDESGVLRDLVVTVGYDLPAIRKALKEFMPYESVGVEMLNSSIVLTGQVSDAAAADRAVRIVEEFISPVRERDGELRAEDIKVMNLLEVASGQQVMLRVRVGEMRRSALKNVGIDLQAVKSGADSALSFGTGGGIEAFTVGSDLGFGGFELGNPDDTRGFLSGSLLSSSGNGVSAMLEALERDNLFKILAEPNLVALSGEESNFLAGGEFPVPVPAEEAIAIEYRPFGVSVKFTPFVLSENRIRIAVQPEVSELNDDGALQLNGFSVPSLTTRRAQTVVELSPGESFMIAGLIQDEIASRVDNLPGIKEVPILGALF